MVHISLLLLVVVATTPTRAMTSTVAAKTLSSSLAAPLRVAIIGGGVSGCAMARRLAELTGSSAHITLYEIGRGPGGRASTRKTRSMPNIYINHGAPYADIRSNIGRSLISSLGPACTVPFQGVRGSIDSTTGKFSLASSKLEGEDDKDVDIDNKPDYITGANGEMSQITTSLIHDIPSIETKYKTMIRGLSRATTPNGEWELRDKSNSVVGVADWLVIAGSGVAHPRWSNTFGGEPPLIAAEQKSPDPKLRAALDSIAKVEASPVLAVFFSCSGSIARRWLSLNYNVLDVKGSSVLSRVMIQGGVNKDKDGGNDDPWCSIVLHSTEDFALQNTGVYGASSSAARTGGAASDASLESSLIEKMMIALKKIPSMPTFDESNGSSSTISSSSHFEYGPALHRWGNAFPKGDALSEELAFLPSSRVAFCGDYVASSEQARFGSFESALLSGIAVGEKIAKYCQQT